MNEKNSKRNEILLFMWVNEGKEKRELRAYENENMEIDNKLDENKI